MVKWSSFEVHVVKKVVVEVETFAGHKYNSFVSDEIPFTDNDVSTKTSWNLVNKQN